MPLPAGSATTGDMPSGVHRATLREVLDRFGTGSNSRRRMALRLNRIHRLAAGTGQVARFIVFGSFVTAKANPNDVDVFLVMEDTFDVSGLTGDARLLFDHQEAQSQFGASVFWVRRLAALGGEKQAIEFWQLKRDGTKRGIVEIQPETP